MVMLFGQQASSVGSHGSKAIRIIREVSQHDREANDLSAMVRAAMSRGNTI
jgi:hypothetical protein